MRAIERARTMLNSAPREAMEDAAGMVGVVAAFFCGFLLVAVI